MTNSCCTAQGAKASTATVAIYVFANDITNVDTTKRSYKYKNTKYKLDTVSQGWVGLYCNRHLYPN